METPKIPRWPSELKEVIPLDDKKTPGGEPRYCSIELANDQTHERDPLHDPGDIEVCMRHAEDRLRTKPADQQNHGPNKVSFALSWQWFLTQRKQIDRKI